MYDGENLGDKKISFNKTIELKNIDFGYSENKIVLKDIKK